MPENHFDAAVAPGYDATERAMFAPAVVDATVDFLAVLAGDGAALELGIGTGRIAVPLARRGVTVHGIDLSPEMVAQLQVKKGSDQIGVSIGDFATTTLDRQFRLAYLVFNTITNLTTQDEQVACFENVGRHLEPGGHFVIEVFVPILRRLPPGENMRVYEWGPTRFSFDEYHVVNQTLVSHHYSMDGDRLRRHSVPFRYVWPAELDLMARLAGMELRERWGGWHREPFTEDSESHVSVWQKVR